MSDDPIPGPTAVDVAGASQSSAAAVHGTPYDPNQPEAGIALCLSGGGYRAMLFHLGSLWRLNEIGLLDRIARISSVSGGSITAGVLGAYWGRRAGYGADHARWFQTEIVSRVRKLAGTTIDWEAVLEGKLPFTGTVAEHIAEQYNKYLFQDKTLQDLPDNPRFVINATSLQSGVLWRFSKPYMGDWKVGRFENPAVKLAQAVGASSAFSPFLSPAVIDLAGEKYMDDPLRPAVLADAAYRTKAVLADGGV